MNDARRAYLPAAGRDWALPLYDPLVTVLGGNPTRNALIDLGSLRSGHRALDIGCGTGSLAVLIKRRYPEVDVVGLDPDPKALARARRKAQRAAVAVRFVRDFPISCRTRARPSIACSPRSCSTIWLPPSRKGRCARSVAS